MGKLDQLRTGYFDRDDFIIAFHEVFDDQEMCNIGTAFALSSRFGNILFCQSDKEYYIIHLTSGTIINWWERLGRANTCNKDNFTIEDLKDLLRLIKYAMEDE